jgi:hypothetical protein
MLKILPVHKKGIKQEISNYRAILNMNSAFKIFERLILSRISEIESELNVDLTGETGDGFTKERSTLTASMSKQTALKLKLLLTLDYYSIIYYNSEVCHLPSLQLNLKNQLLSASAMGLKMLRSNNDLQISYERLHIIEGSATPVDLMKYKLTVQLYKNFNDRCKRETWMALFFQQNYGTRNEYIRITDNSRHKVGRNNLINRLNVLNEVIKYEWLNLSIDASNLRCK